MEVRKEVEVDKLDALRLMAENFGNPLELVREAISNSYDAGANNIKITIKREPWEGLQRWIVKNLDDGAGMVLDEIPSNQNTGNIRNFFSLGKSMRKGETQGHAVGEKGLGIKIAFHSEYLNISTWAGGDFPLYKIRCYKPWARIFEGKLPEYEYEASADKGKPYDSHFTEIEIVGFYDNDGTHFRADEIDDYIRWFTKWGSFEERIRKHLLNEQAAIKLHLGKLRPPPSGFVTLIAPGDTSPRQIPFGHPFPDIGFDKIQPNEKLDTVISKLSGISFEDMVDRLEQAKKKHWRYIPKVGILKDIPDVTWQAIISVEGEDAKRNYNPYLRQRHRSEKYTYKAEDRYGLWFCKDFFCIHQPIMLQWRYSVKRANELVLKFY